MDEFEFSVDISDRDWECFFTQCEECNVLPPSLAGLEDSGMSDMDDIALFAKKAQKSDLNTIGLLEEDEPAGSPCEGPAEELCPGRHSSRGIESILSGSEEDIHLQSVNMFFEQMKSSSDSKRTGEQGEERSMQNRAVQGELKGGGLSARCNGHSLPKNIPKAATGVKTTGAVSTPRNTYSVRTDESSSESSTSLYIRHPYLKTQLYIESSSENTANEHDPVNRANRFTPHSSKVINMGKETHICNVKDYSAHQKTSHLSIHQSPVVNGKWTEDKSTQVSQSDTDSTHKPPSKESSPCTSVKRKRRKKRRLSVEPVENLFTCDRLYDSEDELFTWRRAIDPCFCNWSGLKHQHLKCGFMPPLGQYTLSSSLPAGVEAKDNQPHPRHSQYQSVLTQANYDPTLPKIWTDHEVKNDLVKYSGKANEGFAGYNEVTKPKEDIKLNANHVESVAPIDTSRNEVKSITDSIFPCAESNDRRPALSQIDRGSNAELFMREEAESKKVLPRQRETGPHEQLETPRLIVHQRSHRVENMTPPPNKTAMSISTVTVTDPLDDKTRHHNFQSTCTTSEETSTTLHKLTPLTCNLFMDGNVQKPVHLTENGLNQDLSPNHEITEVCETEAPQESVEGSLIASGNMDQISELQGFLENQSRSTSFSTLSSCHTPETEPLPNENILQTLECSGLCQDGPSLSEERSQVISKDGKMYQNLLRNSQHVSDNAEEPCWDEVEVALTNCESEKLTEPVLKSDHTVFAMSSFWKEMEKLTINDILGLRKENKAPSSFLPSLQEVDDPDCFALSDFGCCTQTEDKKLGQDCKNAHPSIPGPVDGNLSNGLKSETSSRNVLWENEPVPKRLHPEKNYNGKITLNDITGPIITPGVQRGLRRMSKKISVQNLRSLEEEMFSSQSTLKPFDKDACKDMGYLPEDPVPNVDPKRSSIIENFRFSISDMYSYFFSEKQPDSSLESPTEDIVDNFTSGDSVSENYDHFFSEFDTDTFFHAEERKPELVPIFSCSRSSKSKVKLHDGYDYFLVSSSDNSSSESDEEDGPERAPIRVVTRFTRKPSSNDVVTDAYENFYTDRDLKQDFFKTTFSFRNINLMGNTSTNKNMSTNALDVRPLKQHSRTCRIKAMPITLLENQDLVFPDSVLCKFDDEILTRLQQPLIYENLQTAVANPNLDAPLLPLKQSDMCLICIAFASWVLKSANPQVGDAWKAVLLANVSALSAIRYLRKYVKGETAPGEKKPNLKALSSS
ncbi:hypothetical protein NQD34_005559 [Periophthalmus magnuspinnatus]|nr:hypothetical protein NQD34_005559 [Periophthalmus magnuspinnatus]